MFEIFYEKCAKDKSAGIVHGRPNVRYDTYDEQNVDYSQYY